MSKATNLGARSVFPRITKRAGRDCSFKSHARGCLREIIGLFEYLATLNPERFVYASHVYLGKQSKKGYDGLGGEFSQRQRLYALLLAEELGWIRPGFLWGRDGWYVAEHDKLAKREHGMCILPETRTRLARTRGTTRAQHRKQLLQQHDDPGAAGPIPSASPSASLSASPSASEINSECISECICSGSQVVEKAGIYAELDEKSGTSFGTSNPLTRQPSNPILTSKPKSAFDHTGKTFCDGEDQSSQTSLTDAHAIAMPSLLHPNKKPRRIPAGGDGVLVGDVVKWPGDDLAAVVQAFSAGYFKHIDVLVRTYGPQDALLAACHEAYEELRYEQYRGLTSHARLMDVTMRRLDEEDIVAPKPWLAVIKQLRRARQATAEDSVVIRSAMVQ